MRIQGTLTRKCTRTVRRAEMLPSTTQDRLMQPQVIHRTCRTNPSHAAPSHAELLFPLTGHENRHSARRSHQLTDRGAFEQSSCLPTGASVFFYNKCRHRTKSLRCTHSSFSLLTSPQRGCLRTWPSVSRCLLNSAGPPKGPSSFVALRIISHRD